MMSFTTLFRACQANASLWFFFRRPRIVSTVWERLQNFQNGALFVMILTGRSRSYSLLNWPLKSSRYRLKL